MTPEFAKAFCELQAKFTTLPKNKEVKAGSFKYGYTTYDKLLEIVRPLLAEHGFSMSNHCGFVDEHLMMTVRLYHETGESIETSLPLKTTAKSQDFGIELSYMRRYGALCLLGLASEGEDTDGHGADSVPQRSAPARRQKSQGNAGDDAATKRQKHLWAQARATGNAQGLTAPEAEEQVRELMHSEFGDKDKSTKTLTEDEHKRIIKILKTREDAVSQGGE